MFIPLWLTDPPGPQSKISSSKDNLECLLHNSTGDEQTLSRASEQLGLATGERLSLYVSSSFGLHWVGNRSPKQHLVHVFFSPLSLTDWVVGSLTSTLSFKQCAWLLPCFAWRPFSHLPTSGTSALHSQGLSSTHHFCISILLLVFRNMSHNQIQQCLPDSLFSILSTNAMGRRGSSCLNTFSKYTNKFGKSLMKYILARGT